MRRRPFGSESARLRGLRRFASRLRIEALEDRRLLATFTVTNTTDADPGSLRAAILDANANPGSDLIDFNIPGPGVHTIDLTSGALPAIVDTVTLDGNTQPLNGGPATTTPLIEINGATIPVAVSAAPDGLVLALPVGANPSNIRGLAIGGFRGAGIAISGAGSNLIEGSLIGLNAAGTAAAPNAAGVVINGSPNNTVGGTSGTNRNVVSGNTGAGVSIVGAAATGNALQGNLIGTDVSGTLAIPNANGVLIAGASNNAVGGTIVAARNLISGNTGAGLQVSGAGASGNSIQGNYVGLTQSGSAALGNAVGVRISDGAASNSVGGTALGTRNVISGNSAIQVFILGSTNNVVLGNTIGLDATGATALATPQARIAGVEIDDGSTGNTIGGITSTASNVISGSSGPGIQVRGQAVAGVGTAAASNLILGNFVGTDVSGTTRQPNAGGGVVFRDGTTGNTLGGTSGGLARNVISGNTGAGVSLLGAATTGNVIQANTIGLQADNGAVLGNTGDGVFVDGAINNQVGGLEAAATNTIAGNDGAGVFINSGNRIAIRRNSIYDNKALGIDLAPRGVNPNTATPSQTGPNNLQNYPVITGVTTSGTTTTVSGTLASVASRTFTIELFSNTARDPSGFGQGRTFVGSTTVTTDAAGNATFSVPTTTAVALGAFLSATATDPDGNTSEFAADAVNVAPSVDLNVTLTPSPSPVAVGGVLTYTVTVSNGGPSVATNVVLTDTLPSGVNFIGATTSLGSVTQAGTSPNSTVTATLGTLAAGQTATITITVVAPTGGTITNTAVATLAEADSNPANNTATVATSVVQGVDLVVRATTTPSSATVGSRLAITFTVTNGSATNTAPTVNLTAPLPSGATVAGSSSSQGSTSTANNRLVAAFGALAPGASANVTLLLNPTAAGTLTVAATATSDLPEVDPNTNSVAAVVTVNAASTNPVGSDGPRVVALNRTGFRRQPTTYVATFDGPLETPSATARSNYRLFSAGRDGQLGTQDDVAIGLTRPFYDATNNTVSIRTRRAVSLHRRVTFAINGTAPNGVRGANGQLLDGNNDGQPGGNFTRTFKGVGPGRIRLSVATSVARVKRASNS